MKSEWHFYGCSFQLRTRNFASHTLSLALFPLPRWRLPLKFYKYHTSQRKLTKPDSDILQCYVPETRSAGKKHHWYIWDKATTTEGLWYGNRIGHNEQQSKMLNFRGWNRLWVMSRLGSYVYLRISSQLHKIQAGSFSSGTSMENCSLESNMLQDPLISSVHEKLLCCLELLPKSISIS